MTIGLNRVLFNLTTALARGFVIGFQGTGVGVSFERRVSSAVSLVRQSRRRGML